MKMMGKRASLPTPVCVRTGNSHYDIKDIHKVYYRRQKKRNNEKKSLSTKQVSIDIVCTSQTYIIKKNIKYRNNRAIEDKLKSLVE